MEHVAPGRARASSGRAAERRRGRGLSRAGHEELAPERHRADLPGGDDGDQAQRGRAGDRRRREHAFPEHDRGVRDGATNLFHDGPLRGRGFRQEPARDGDRFGRDDDVGEAGVGPQVRLEASYEHFDEASRTVDQTRQATLTGRVTVPLYEGGGVQARVRQAKHTHVSRLQEIEQARSETQANVTAAWSRMMAARAQLQSDEVQVEAARTALDGVREEEKVGQRTLLDVLNAEQEYLDAQVALISTRRDLVVASYGLLAAMGRLSAEGLALTQTVYDPEENYREVRHKWFGLSITHADGRRETMRVSDEQEGPDDLAD